MIDRLTRALAAAALCNKKTVGNLRHAHRAGLFIGLVCILFFGGLPTAFAHDTPIATLKLTERQDGVYALAWNYSSSTNTRPPQPSFPSHCEQRDQRLYCGEQGLVGKLSFAELGERYSAVVVQISKLSGASHSFTFTGATPSITLSADGKLSVRQVASAYIPLGFEHILLGIDHLLFVLGLMLLVTNPWMLTKTVTAFTIAHSLSLAAATFGWVGVPDKTVNALIALSIVVVAVEVVKTRRGEVLIGARWPWAVAFGFGLLHGFGFATALTGAGLPAQNLPAALLFFNIGVELGQLAFIGVVLALFYCHRFLQAEFPKWCSPTAIYSVGSVAGYWFISRTVMMLAG